MLQCQATILDWRLTPTSRSEPWDSRYIDLNQPLHKQIGWAR